MSQQDNEPNAQKKFHRGGCFGQSIFEKHGQQHFASCLAFLSFTH